MFQRFLRSIRSLFRTVLPFAPSPSFAREDIQGLKSYLCGLAESIASEDFGTTLDYSVDSIKDVESILASMHVEYQKTQSDVGLNGVALEFAAYIVTVIDRHFGPATWERDHLEFGPDVFPLLWRGSTLFPYSWCQKRIFDGPADNVWFKFYALILKNESEKSQ